MMILCSINGHLKFVDIYSPIHTAEERQRSIVENHARSKNQNKEISLSGS